jgi:peptidoglycan/LPS O-acetylase OafA/YrhL
MQAGEPRSAAIESLRAVAAMGVVVAHTLAVARTFQGRNPGPPSGVFERLIASGTFSVYLFFVLSGYLLFLPFAKQAFAAGPRIELRRYAANRALRILPLLYVSLVVYLIAQNDLTLHQLLVFGTFSENFSSATAQTVNVVLWSLVIELHFYLLLPLLALVVGRLSRGSVGRALALVAALGLASLALRWTTFYADPTPNPVLRFSVLSCFMFFAAGMTLALLRLRWQQRPPPALAGPLGAPAVWMSAALAAWLVLAYADSRGRLAVVASFLLVGAVVLPLRASRLTSALAWRPLAALGVASYSLYIWHVLVLRTLANHFWLDSFGSLLAVGLPACFAVAFASYAMIERPFLRWRRRWGSNTGDDRRRTRTPASHTAAAGARGGGQEAKGRLSGRGAV